MPITTANWHWKNKNVTSWAKTWFQEELTKISIQGDAGEGIKVTSTSWLDGDVELGQRKSKCVSFYLRFSTSLDPHPQVDHHLRLQNLC